MNHGVKFIRNYSFIEYDHQPQNWGMAQAENGILFFANQAGVLEFDGVTWRVHDLIDKEARSLAIDESGTVFVGGNNHLWYLVPAADGKMKYVSLTEHINKKYRNFGYVWSTHYLKNKVYFRTSRYLFIWDYKKITSLEAFSSLKSSFILNGELIVQDGKEGLVKPVNNKLHAIPGGKSFAGKRIALLTPYFDGFDKKSILTGNSYNRFALYNKENITPFTTEADDHISKYRLSHGLKLSTGEFALGTAKGLLIIDKKGNLSFQIDKTSGLQSDNIKFVFQDTGGNIWLCMDSGISKIEYHSPFSIIRNTSAISGIVMTVATHNNTMYVGTRDGLYFAVGNGKFVQIPGFAFSCNHLLSTGSHLLAATHRGVFQFENHRPVEIAKYQSLRMLQSKYFPRLTWCGTNWGVVALVNHNNRWQMKFSIDSVNSSISSIAETSSGELWLGTGGSTVFRVRFSNGFQQPKIARYNHHHGLKGNQSRVAKIMGRIVVTTSKGLFQFKRKKNAFIPSPLLGNKYAGGEKSKPVFLITEDHNNRIWFTSQSRTYLAVTDPKGIIKTITRPFRRMPEIQTNSIYYDPVQKTVWFARHDGLYSYDTAMEKDYGQPFKTLIRKVILNESSNSEIILFSGNTDKSNVTSASTIPRIEFKNRNLYIEYAAPFFEAENKIKYKSFLEGYDNNWSAWNKETKKYYTNLEPGVYKFRVQAKNVYETVAKEDQYYFRILTPWYGQWWMYLIYLLFVLVFISQVVRWRSRKLLKEKQLLEATVKERTKEIGQKNRQLERQTIQLQNQSEKLKEMDKVKSRFFTNISHEFRTPLTLLMGPLEHMYTHSENEKEKQNLSTMLRNSQRLLNLINQLLDLSRMDSGKEKTKAANQDIVSFLKGIIANFKPMAEQKKLGIRFHAEPQPILLYFDNQKMEKIMNNLLMNAVKYTPPGGHIIVSVFISREEQEVEAASPEWVKISVKDSGAGIPPDQIDSIFDRFVQAERLKTNSQEGTGIGLALVKEYVQLHKGNIDLHSLEGKGTEFVLRFPTGSSHLEPGEITDTSGPVTPLNQPYIGIETMDYVPNGKDEHIDETEPKPVILVVEDNADIRRYISGSLQPDYAVAEAIDGTEGIEKAKKVIPDLIISDIMMPGVDGYQLSGTLKNDIKTSHIPIILLTAKASEESIIQGLETGADDYITKPFNTQILLTRIKNLIELRLQLQLKIQKQMLLQPDEIKVSSMDQEFIKDLKTAIDKHKSEPGFGVEKLSKLTYMDRVTLYRKIKALTGETPQIFIRSYRLQIAAQLLEARAGTVSQVASTVGFDNVAYFAKCFKEKFDIIPSSFAAAESGQSDPRGK
jgi:signal transduction histidine kinase/CheY-like chemotaxis protein